jgi:hypothetical protein
MQETKNRKVETRSHDVPKFQRQRHDLTNANKLEAIPRSHRRQRHTQYQSRYGSI